MRFGDDMKTSGEGTGPGLAINVESINGIVRENGGGIVAESGKESGSTFRIRLPLGEGNG